MTLDLKNPVPNFLFWFCFLLFCSNFCFAIDTIKRGESIRDGGETLLSKGETFELGFFSPENSTLRYLGIWYYKTEVKPVVWVANRDSPISGTNGVFRIQNDGNLVVLDGNNSIIWISNATVESTNTAAILLDSGNFVLSSNLSIGDTSKAYWQSFDHPTDTYLPGMRVLVSSSKGQNHVFTSWKSGNDPSSGNFTMGVDPYGAPQIVIWNGTDRLWRSGQWNGVVFIGVPFMSSLASIFYGFKLSQPASDGSMYFTYVPSNASDLLRFRIGWNGSEEQLRWEADKKIWDVVQIEPMNECEFYNACGNFGVCDISRSPRCSCPQGFQPKFQEQWSRGSFSGGCVRKTELQCQRNASNVKQDGFKGLKGIKLPDFAHVVSLGDSETCSENCLGNCSCNAYADITGIGCMIWTGDLLDLQHFNNGGSSMFLRLPHSELGSGMKTYIIVIIAVCSVIGVCLLCISIWLFLRFKRKQKKGKEGKNPKMASSIPVYNDNSGTEFSKDLSGSVDLVIDGSGEYGPDLPIFNAKFIAASTNNYSEENKLGQGGFGPVYKGELPGGQEIAVKRLAGKSCQGLEEFKNEIIMIAKLQHRNLVRLLGCCIQGEEKMLLYEYMPNKSLDYFLFDEAKQALLDWRTRFTIIEGIARGLLYLHRDSRLRIIHRDLKASNILLDADMIPKISDFGMARIFGTNQIEANTIRVVGTYGYMSPEYAMEGLFSIKSDVYSFGVLLLEIVSGRRNNSFRASDHTSLIGYAWDLWNENKPMELIDPAIKETCDAAEVLKCIHVGMLCVQDFAGDRPRMEEVVRMLESEAPTLPAPRQPTYTSMRSTLDAESLLDVTVSSSDATVSMVSGR